MTTPLDSSIFPEAIEREGEFGLVIQWSDGSRLTYKAVTLRDGCPCATCKEKQRAKELEREKAGGKVLKLPVLSAGELQPLRILRMQPVGNYAYNIAFSDGHDSGIFTFDLLRQLGTL